MKMYHATDFENLSTIIVDGLQPKLEGIFLAESKRAALAFLMLRPIEKIVVIEVDVDESKLTESFDHNEKMFCKMFGLESCRAFIYPEAISVTSLDQCTLYDKGKL